MGDRTNVVITGKSTEDARNLSDALQGAVVLYSHNDGYYMGPKLAAALRKARVRWNDEGYGTRIIVSQIIGGDWNDEYGYGLYAGQIGDNERSVLVVDFDQQKVRRFGEPGKYLGPGEAPNATPTGEWTFEEFAALNEKEARTAHLGFDE